MIVSALLEELRSRHVQVWADGDQLRCSAPAGVLTPELRAQLRQRKGDILAFLRSAEAFAQQQRAIVPLQPRGPRVPVFAVPGHSGDVFCYRALAQHLGDDQPFFGLQPPGVDGQSEPLTCVEDLAAYFAAQIRAFRPAGPYVIAGYCAGGTIAFAVARHLLQHGAAISFVALFTSPYPTWYRVLPQLRQRFAHQVERVREHARALAPLSYGGRYRRSSRCVATHLAISPAVCACSCRTRNGFALAMRCCAGDRSRATLRSMSGRTAASATACSSSPMFLSLQTFSGAVATTAGCRSLPSGWQMLAMPPLPPIPPL